MNVLVHVTGQRINIKDNNKQFVAGSQQFVRFVFVLDDSWDGLNVSAQFIQNGTAYNVPLDNNNSAYLPSAITAGTCKLLLYGTGSTVIGTTNYLTLTINENALITP